MILTPDQRLRVFVSSTLGELAAERAVVRDAVESLRMAPVMFEMGARPHPPRALYRAYLEQSHVFLAIYANQYGWVAPTMDISGLEDEFRLSGDRPKLVYVLDPAPERDPQLTAMLADVAADARVRLRTFGSAAELAALAADDLAALLAEPFDSRAPAVPAPPAEIAGSGELPLPPSPMVGRDVDADAVTALLRRQDVRLVTLTGIGGIGKSRLALEVAHRLQAELPGRVVHVPLAEVPEPGLVITTIASRMGVRLETARPSLEVVAESVAARGSLLLVLDNAEQVPDAASDLATLISTCPQLTVLVTSRSRLRLVAEHDYPLAPLDFGPPVDTLGFSDPAVDPAEADRSAEQSDAVRLFLDRARATRPDLDLAADPVQRSAVVQLCRRLEGVPLAIEIAAARVRLLTPTQLLDRLDRSLDLPAARLADLPERQRTLRSTLDWSYDLLAPGEQALLAALSTFVGGASLSAIEEVISIDGDVLESLAILADHSLIGVDAWVIDAPRFTMLETVRDYAREKLEAAGLATTTDEAHRAWVRGLAERASAGLIGVEHDEWLERLELESGNIRTAGTRANAAGDPQALVHAGYRLWLWLWARHHTREARLWLERALDFIDTLDDRTTAQLQWALAGAAVEQGDNEAAVSRLSAAIELFTALDDREGLALCKFIDGSLAPLSGEPDRAIERLTSGAEDLQASGNVFVASICWSMTGVFHAQLGRFQEAETYFDRSLSQAESIDNAMLRGTTYASRGFARLDRGAVDEAAADFAAGAAWAWQARNPELLSFACDGIAAVLLARGIPAADGSGPSQPAEQAALLVGAADGLRDKVGIVPWPGMRAVMAAIAEGVRAAAGAAAFDDAHLQARRLTSAAVLELVLRAAGVAPTTAPGSPAVEPAAAYASSGVVRR